jgi:hypothetical protein
MILGQSHSKERVLILLEFKFLLDNYYLLGMIVYRTFSASGSMQINYGKETERTKPLVTFSKKILEPPRYFLEPPLCVFPAVCCGGISPEYFELLVIPSA